MSSRIAKGTEMGSNPNASRAIVVVLPRGYAIVPSDELQRIKARFDLIDRIAGCTTWGAYRSLGNHELEDYVLDHVHFEEELGDDEPFSVNLLDYADPESSFLNYEAALEWATQDFLFGISDERFPHGAVERIGPWSFVTESHLKAVCDALDALGYVVRSDSEES